MAKKIIIKATKKDGFKSGKVVIKRERPERIQKGLVKGHKRSAQDGFSMEIPPKKPIITKPKNEDEKQE